MEIRIKSLKITIQHPLLTTYIHTQLSLMYFIHSDEGGDDGPTLVTAPDPGAVEQHPADAFPGHRLLLRTATGLHDLPRSQPSQHAERRMGSSSSFHYRSHRSRLNISIT